MAAELALTSISCSSLWRISDDFNAPKFKSISQIHNKKTFQIDNYVSNLLRNFAFFMITKLEIYRDLQQLYGS